MTGGSWRLRVYPLVILGALAAAILVAVVTADGADSLRDRFGGDLPAFYGAGRIVAEGDGVDLYEPVRQTQAQAGLWSGGDDQGMLFAYPALLAGPYVAASSLGFTWTYLLHTAVMVLAVVVAARLLVDRLPLTAGRAWLPLGLAFAFTFLPMFVGVANGQTTALILLAVVAWWVLLADGRDLSAGLVAGALLLKPQYAVVLIGLMVLGRRWRGVGAAIGGAAVVWAGSAVVAGPGWTGRWLDLVSSMSDIDGGVNLPNEVSWFGLAEVAFGQGSTAAVIVGGVAILVTAGVLVWTLRAVDPTDPRAIAVLLPSLLLIAPHALYYDAGILVVALAALLPTVRNTARPGVAALWWATGLTHIASDRLGVEPVAVLVLATWAWSLWAIHAPAASPDTSSTPASAGASPVRPPSG